MVAFAGPLTDWERGCAGRGGITHVVKIPAIQRVYLVLDGPSEYRGAFSHLISVFLPSYKRLKTYNEDIPTPTKVGLNENWHRLHLWGPILGDGPHGGKSLLAKKDRKFARKRWCGCPG
jgi:hypothetical protein